MSFPKRFKPLLEPDPSSIPHPDYVWLVWAVCGCDESACGWAGWVIEAVFKYGKERQARTGGDDILAADDHLSCPNCGRPLFRTEVSLRLAPSEDQRPTHGRRGIDYKVRPMEYE